MIASREPGLWTRLKKSATADFKASISGVSEACEATGVRPGDLASVAGLSGSTPLLISDKICYQP
jgi:hypothetical protein